MPSIFIVDSYYQAVIDVLGFGQGGNPPSSYDDGVEALVSHGFGTGGAYHRELRTLGWDADISVPNSYTLQRQWLFENRYPRPFSKGWSYGLYVARMPLLRTFLHHLPHIQGTLFKQITRFKPDVVFVQDLNMLTPALAKAIRQHTKLLVGEIASPLPPKPYFTQYDLIISALPAIVEKARQWGIDSNYLPLGFDSRWLHFAGTPVSDRSIEAVFVGSFSRHQPQTVPLLQEVGQAVPGLQIYGNAPREFLEKHGLSSYFRGPAWGQEMYKILGDSKIVVNRHGTIAGDYAVNMRMYESTGMGATLLTEDKSNLADLFRPGIEVATYRTTEEAAVKVKELLGDPVALETMASLGQARTLKEHTYAERAKELSRLLITRLESNG